MADIYSTSLWQWNAAALVTPPPRESETRERFAGVETRLSWWRPGWGDRHPGIMIANGATAFGNDDPETRRLAEALARGGYLVMLPEFPFLKEVRFDRAATDQMDAAFALLRASSETRGRTVGAFGSSVGAGMLLAAAHQNCAGRLEPWSPDPVVRDKLPAAARDAMDTDADRAALRAALDGGAYDVVLARLRTLPASARARLEQVSPRSTWATLRPPVYWLHDANDRFEPIGEAEAAAAAPRGARLELTVSHLISHAAPVDAEEEPRSFGGWAGELRILVGFGLSVMRAAE